MGVVAMETASKYMSDHKAAAFIRIACDTINEDRRSNRACDVWSGSLSSSSSLVWAKSSVPPFMPSDAGNAASVGAPGVDNSPVLNSAVLGEAAPFQQHQPASN